MQSRQWIAGMVMGLVLVLGLAGCGAFGSQGAPADPTGTVESPTEPQTTLTPVLLATPVPAGDYAPVAIPDAGLQVDVPAGWQRQAEAWVWQPQGDDERRIGVAWMELPPPQEVEAALLPESAQTLVSDVVEFEIGEGRRFLIEVYEPAAEGSTEQGAVRSVELHVLVVSVQEGRRIGYDLYATAPSRELLSTIEPVFEHMLASVTFLDLSDIPSVPGEASQPAVDQARTILARHLSISADGIVFVSAEYVDWPDGCLGIQLPDRACTQAIVPGYRIIFEVNGEQHEVRTDVAGNSAGIVP
jgi:hypothetical protein